MTRTPAAVPPFPERMEGEPTATQFVRRGIVTASQWFKLGDHPAVWLRKRWPEPRDECQVYWLGRPDAGRVVLPGDWIYTDERGDVWSCSAEHFHKMWRPLAEITRLSITREPQEG